jgi:hypothetical protein
MYVYLMPFLPHYASVFYIIIVCKFDIDVKVRCPTSPLDCRGPSVYFFTADLSAEVGICLLRIIHLVSASTFPNSTTLTSVNALPALSRI